MCEAQATSREHVPPRCIFPELAESGRELRTDLITVPSCDLHNSGKSRDDEFLMVSLAGVFGNNSTGYAHRLGKVNRAVLRSSRRLLSAVFKRRRSYVVQLEQNGFLELIWGTPDLARLQACFDRIARALHLHHFGTPFRGEVVTHFGYVHPTEPNAGTFRDFLRHRVALDLADKPRLGSNPDVFYYRVADPDVHGLYLLELCFYGGLNVYTTFLREGKQRPVDLAMSLIEVGIPTTLTLEGRLYHFNADGSDDDNSSRGRPTA